MPIDGIDVCCGRSCVGFKVWHPRPPPYTITFQTQTHPRGQPLPRPWSAYSLRNVATHKYNTLTHSCPRVLPLLHTHAQTRTRTRVYAHLQPTITHTHTHKHTCTLARAHTYTYTHTCTPMPHAYEQKCVYTRTHAQTHAQAHTLANAHTHAHAHILHTHARKDT